MENNIKNIENINEVDALKEPSMNNMNTTQEDDFSSYVKSYLKDTDSSSSINSSLNTSIGAEDTEIYSPIDKRDMDFRKFQIDNLVNQSRNRVSELSNRLNSNSNPKDEGVSWWKNITQENDAFKRYDTDIDDVYTRLNSGKLIPKYESYLPQVDNEDRLAKKQTTTEKWVNGLTKFVGKVPTAILGNTLGSIEGLAEGLSKGELAAVYNNSYTSLMDDLFTRLDISLPNYSSKSERDSSFVSKMGTANFWANDFLGGTVHTVAAIGTEAIMAGITGGSSIVGSAGRLALKAGTKVASKNLLKNTAKIIKNYNRSIPASKTANALNNLRFLYTSAGAEASLEAFQSHKEALDNYFEYYKNSHNGELPSDEEFLEFKKDLTRNSNMVYGANLALVGASNIAQFGSYFGIGTGLSKKVTDVLGKRFGLGITRVGEGGNLTYKALKPSRVNRILGTTAMVLKEPIMEGVIEEGGQRAINITSQEWLKSKYDPNAMKNNINLIEAAIMGLEDTYGTKEGWHEVGLGMLIGAAGGIGRRGVRGRWSALGLTEYSQMVEEKEHNAQLLNENYNKVTDATNNLFERLARTNQFSNYLNKAERAKKNGDFHSVSQDYETAMFSKMLIDLHSGMLEEGLEDFKRVVEHMDTSQLSDEYNLSESDIKKYKKSLVEDFETRVKLFNKSYNIAESLGIRKDNRDYTEDLAMNIYLGHTAKNRADALADSIGDMMNDNGVASFIKTTSTLSDELLQLGEDIVKKEDEINKLEKSYQEIKNSLDYIDDSVLRNKDALKDVSSKRVRELNTLREQELEQRNALTSLMNEKQQLENQLETINNSKNAFSLFYDNSNNQLSVVEAIKGLKKIDAYRKYIKEKSPEIAKDIDELLHNYIASIKSARLYYEVYKGVTSPSFMKNNKKKENKNEEVKNTPIMEETTDLDEFTRYDAYIDGLDNGLSKSSKETLKTLYRISKSNVDTNTIRDELEAINEVEEREIEDNYNEDGNVIETNKDLKDSIVQKLRRGDTLSQEEEDYMNKNKQEIEDLLEKDILDHGDPIPGQEKNKLDSKNPINSLLETIKDGLKNTHIDPSTENIDSKLVTIDDINKLKNLVDRENKGKITPQQHEELKDLRDKVRDWIIISGTELDSPTLQERVTLADLIEEYLSLQKPEPQVKPIKVVEDTSNVDTNPSSIRNYDFLQSYDKALIKKNSSGYEISNISLNGILNTLGSFIPVALNGKELHTTEDGWNIENIKPKDVYTLDFGDYTVGIKIGANNTLNIKTSDVDILNEYTPLYINSSLSNTLYGTLYRKVLTEDKTLLKPIDSDFNNVQIDTSNIYQLKKGDLLSIEVNKNDPYNKALLQKYSKKPTKENLKSVKDKLLISLVNNNGDTVGVLKGINNGIMEGDTNSILMNQLRQKVSEDVINNTNSYGNIKVPVKDILIGHANLGLELIEDKANQVLYDVDLSNVNSIKDVGYVLNGTITTRNNTNDFEQYPYISDIKKNPSLKDSKVPFAVIEYQGKRIGYPLVIKAEGASLSDTIKSIIDSEDITHNKILRINKLLSDVGIDPTQHGVTSLTYNKGTLDNILSLLPKYNFNIEDLMNKNIELKDSLVGKTQLNIDLRDELFHSPKIQVDYSPIRSMLKSTKDVDQDTLEESSEVKMMKQDLKEGITNDSEIDNNIKENVYNSSNTYEFDKKINNIDIPLVVNKYNTDNKFKKEVRERYMNLQRVPVCEVKDGVLEFSTTSTTAEELMNTVLIENENNTDSLNNINSTIAFLNTISGEVWNEEKQKVKNLLKKVERYFTEFNIDVIGMNEEVDSKSRSEVLAFLNSMNSFLKDLATGKVDGDYIEGVSQNIDTFLGKEPSQAYDYIKKPSNGLSSIFRIDKPLSAINAYKNHSLLRIGKFLYKKINDKNTSTDWLYNRLYESLADDPNILPKEAFYPKGFDQKNRLKSRETILEDYNINDLKRYINNKISKLYEENTNYNKEDYERLVLLNLLYDNRFVEEDTYSKPTLDRISTFTGDANYLSSTFIGDFRGRILKEKLKDSELYNSALKYFTFKDNQIHLNTINPLVLEQIRNSLPNDSLFTNFKEYCKFVKDNTLNDLFVEENTKELTHRDYGVLYSNFPELLPMKDITLQKLSEGVYSTPIATEEYIRTKEGLFEFYKSIDGNNIYRQIYTTNTTDYIDFNVQKAVINKEDLVSSNIEVKQDTNVVEIANINKIKNNIDDC